MRRDRLQKLRLLLRPESERLSLDMLLSSADARLPRGDRIDWLVKIVGWLRVPVQPEQKAPKKRGRALQTARLRFMLMVLDRNPSWKSQVAGVIRSLLHEVPTLDFFSIGGLAKENRIVSEAFDRTYRRILPRPSDETEMADVVSQIFSDENDPEWIKSLPPEIWLKLVELIQFENPRPELMYRDLHRSMIDSLIILGPQIASLGLSGELRGENSISDSPFRQLNQYLDHLHVVLSSHPFRDPQLVDQTDHHQLISSCRSQIDLVYKRLDTSGVSVRIVFMLDRLTMLLNRVELILMVLIPNTKYSPDKVIESFLSDLIQQSQDSSGLGSLLSRNFDLLARKVVERVGLTGEHYITTDRAGYWRMLLSGAGGGIVTVFTTVFKMLIAKASLPLFFEGLFTAINYSASFLLMQAAHFSLATKQPSMTASALANKLRSLNKRQNLRAFAEEVARITRSQFAAAVGNVGFVIPGAILLHLLISWLFHAPVMSPSYAQKTLESLNPFTSLTVPAAAITGVLLWASALTGGWVENWVVFHRLPEAMASNPRLRRIFGKERMVKFADRFVRSIAGIASNVAIGCYLAFTPVLGSFFGLPLDIRHVTLSSGSLTFAICSLGFDQISLVSVGLAVFGILLILILNFGVSFGLALFVALRARRIKRIWVYHLLRAVGRRFRKRSREFFIPPRNSEMLDEKTELTIL